MSEEEKEDIENLIKRLSYCELEYEQNGYLSVGKFDAIKQAINLIKKQQEEIEELNVLNEVFVKAIEEWVNGERINDIKHISKDKINEKIKEIEKVKENIIEKTNSEVNVTGLQMQIEVLQELLEE